MTPIPESSASDFTWSHYKSRSRCPPSFLITITTITALHLSCSRPDRWRGLLCFLQNICGAPFDNTHFLRRLCPKGVTARKNPHGCASQITVSVTGAGRGAGGHVPARHVPALRAPSGSAARSTAVLLSLLKCVQPQNCYRAAPLDVHFTLVKTCRDSFAFLLVSSFTTQYIFIFTLKLMLFNLQILTSIVLTRFNCLLFSNSLN